MTFLIILTSVLFLLCIVLALFMLKAMRSEAQIRNQATVRESELKNQAVVREAELQSEAAALHTRNDALSREIEAMEKRIEESREQMKTIVQQQEERFKNIATEILNNSTKQFNETSNQRLGDILNPLTGEVQERLLAPAEGIVFTLREYPIVSEGSLIARLLRLGR